MRTKSQLSEAVTDGIDKFLSDHEGHERLKIDLYWLFSGNDNRIDQLIDRLLSMRIFPDMAADIHDLVSQPSELTNEEQTKLHFVINLKA